MPEYSYKFYELNIGKKRILRPMLPVLLRGPTMGLETGMLVDSGADVSMIQRELAEQLGLAFHGVESTGGISGELPVHLSSVEAEIRFGNAFLPTMRLPLQIPTDYGLPPLPLLGREVFFFAYDISFRMGYTPTKGKFVLKPVARRRDADRYR